MLKKILKFCKINSIRIGLLFATIGTIQTQAQLIAYDDFDATSGTILNAYTGGSGWTGAYELTNASTDFALAASLPLSYTSLATNGNYASYGGGYNSMQRTLDVSSFTGYFSSVSNGIGSSETGTLWISMLYRNNGTYTDMTYLNFHNKSGFGGAPWEADNGKCRFGIGRQNTSNTDFKLFVSDDANDFGSSNKIATSVNIVLNQTYLIVFKVVFTTGGQGTISLFINPTVGVEPTVPSASYTSTNPIQISKMYTYGGDGGSRNVSVDELRFGKTYTDVTPMAAIATTSISGINISGSSTMSVNGASQTYIASPTPITASSPITYKWECSDPDAIFIPINDSPTITGFPNKNGVFNLIVTLTGPLNTYIETKTITISNQNPVPLLMANEPFDYPLNSTNPGNGGIGFASAWTPQDANHASPNSITSGFLSYSTLSTSGNSLTSATPYNGYNRRLDLNSNGNFASTLDLDGKVGRKGTSIWISTLFSTSNASDSWELYTHNRTDGVYPDYIQAGSENRLQIKIVNVSGDKLFALSQFSVSGNTNATMTPIVNNTTYFVVAKIEFSSNISKVYLFVNPTLGSTPSNASAVAVLTTTSDLSFSAIGLFNLANYTNTTDEIRLGNTFSSVSPTIPVVAVALTSATISGANSTSIGNSTTYSVNGYSPANASTPVSTVWYSSNTTVATIDGTSGALTALSAGTTNVYAIHDNPANTTIMSNMIMVTVSSLPVALTSATISGANSTSIGNLISYSVVGYSPANATSPVSTVWYSSNTAVATINGASGALTALSAGTTNVYAIHNNPANTTIMSNMIMVTVSSLPIALISATISGTNSIVIGGLTAYSVSGYNPTNASTPVSTVWYSSNTSVVTIDGVTGIAKGLAIGTANVYAIHNNPANTTIMSNMITLSVTSLPVGTIALASSTISGPNTATVGGTATYTVNGYLPSNASTPVSTVWYTSNPVVATIDGVSGVLTALSAGTVDVFAIHSNPATTTIMSNLIMVTITSTNTITTGGINSGLNNPTDVVVYPNPASDFVQIKSESVVTKLNLIDLAGKSILSSSSSSLSIAELNSGMYILEIYFENGIIRKSIIKQ